MAAAPLLIRGVPAASAVTVHKAALSPFRSSVPPDNVRLLAPGMASADPSFNVPAAIVTAVNVSVPVRVRSPVPAVSFRVRLPPLLVSAVANVTFWPFVSIW